MATAETDYSSPQASYKIATPSRANREAISVAGMVLGLCDMLLTSHPGKIKMAKYEEQLRAACEGIFQAYGKLDAASHGGAPKNIEKLDAFWTEHRDSPAVYTAMVLPMTADIETTMPKAVALEKRRSITAVRILLEKIYKYLNQYRQTSEDMEEYAASLYLYWQEFSL